MYYLKTKEFKYLVINWGRDDADPMNFTAFKHKGQPWTKRFTKVIDITLWGRRLLLEF
jgi:hypothetical protein